MTVPTRVLVAEDHPVTRMGLAALIRDSPDLQLVYECECAEDVLRACRHRPPDVAIIDLILPDADGWELIAQLKAIAPSVRIVVISALEGLEPGRRAFEAGAVAFVHKAAAATTLVSAIRKAQAGLAPSHLFAPNPQVAPAPFQLTDRERDVLRGIVRGLTNQEIAVELGIGVGTVRTHVMNVLAKLDVDRRSGAAMIAVRFGLV